MSAIAGIVNFDGAPVDPDLLRRMELAGASRGPDAEGRWVNNSVGFVFCGVWPFREPPVEQQPFYDPESGLVVMLDGHVHARDELCAACAAAGHPVRTCGEAELVLRAYQAWGNHCPRYILGEYAFTIWDPMHHRLVCARDAFGIRPLFYVHIPNISFRFATGANQLLVDPTVPRTADMEGVVQLLVGYGDLDPHRTPCSSVRRVPAAHTLVVDEHGIRIQQYWSLDDEVDKGLSQQKDYVPECVHTLQLAIRDRLPGSDPVGISLSGGWDSGAIFTLWQWMRCQGEPLPPPWTHTHYCDYPEADEREEVRALVRRWPAEGSFMQVAADSLLIGLEEHVTQLGMPEATFAWRYLRQQAAEVRAARIRTVLTGEGGNYVVQSSWLRPVDLLRAGRPRAALAQLKIWEEELHRSPREFLWPYLVKPVLPLLWPGLWEKARHARHALSGTPTGFPYLTKSAQEILSDLTQPFQAKHWRKSQGMSLAAWDQRMRLEQVQQSLFPLASASDLEGIVLSAPYLDRRVVRIALAALAQEALPAPSRDLLGKVLERTAGHRLPGNYAHVTQYVNDALRADLRTGNPLFTASILVELGIVDRGGLQAFLADYTSGRDQNQFSVWRLVSVEAWARCWLANGLAPKSWLSSPCSSESIHSNRRFDHASAR